MPALRARVRETREKLVNGGARVLQGGLKLTSSGFEEFLKTSAAQYYLTSHFIDGAVLPAADALIEIQRDTTRSLMSVLQRQEKASVVAKDLGQRMWSGTRYWHLVRSLGGTLFASARFEGETVLCENDFFRLSYLPPKGEAAPLEPAVFHAGGFIPYGDGIFRLLPEANLYDRFLERGIAVYAMELRERDRLPRLSRMTLEMLIDHLDELTRIAFEHRQSRKMVIEGYCGNTVPMLAFLCARPQVADTRFSGVMTMVAPIDGTQCPIFAEAQKYTPRSLVVLQMAINEVLFGQVRGVDILTSMDLAIENVFPKTPLGRFTSGWRNKSFAQVRSPEDLTPAQRLELTGAYWISIENAKLNPVPVDLMKFHNRIFRDGIDASGALPATFQGHPLSLKTLLEETSLRIVGIYGGADKMIPDATGRVLGKIFGSRYQHVLHPKAGHVSYIFSPSIWKKGDSRALQPNPADLVLELSQPG